MAKTIQLGSGANLEITMADFEEGEALMEAVVSELNGITINEKSDHIEVLKNIFARAILSPSIKKALLPCLEKCRYNNQKYSKDVFQDEKARGDYLIVLKEVLEYNLTPFFVNLISTLRDLGHRAKALQK